MKTGWMVLLALATVCAGAESNPEQVMARLRNTVIENAARIPNYTCVEVVERHYYYPQFAATGVARALRSYRDCEDLAAGKQMRGYKLILSSMDRLRLDVRVGPDREVYSWPGAAPFEERDVSEIIPGFGPIATGPFGALLLSIFQRRSPEFPFTGETAVEGRKLFAYSFRVPIETSRYYIRVWRGPQIVTGYEGTILVDPENSELVRLTARATGVALKTPYCEVATTLDYTRVRIGETEFLLPKEARQRFIALSGRETENVVTFSACREFRADSKLAFGDAPIPPAAGSKSRPAPPPLYVPPGLPFTIELTTPIDSASAAAGDPFTGKLSKPIEDGRVIVPRGAIVRGRITRVGVRMQSPEVIIVLKPESLETGGNTFPFQATGKTTAAWIAQRKKSFASRGQPIGELYKYDSGIGGLRFSGRRETVKIGYKTKWVTGAP